ncbi:MAG: MFS transporter, partial [Acetobacteraceae bacterium]
SRFWWSAVFWARAPVAALAGLLAVALPASAARDRAVRFDTVGALLLVTALIALLLAINRAGDTLPFILLATITVVSVWAFIRQQHRSAHPIIDLALFRKLRFAALNMANVLINLAGFSVPLLVPFQLARLPDFSIVLDGALLALSPAGTFFGAHMAPRLADRVPAGRMLLIGTALVALGLLTIALLAGRVWWLGVAMLVHGLGQGLFQVAYFDIITASMALRDRGVAGSLGMLTRTLGIVSGASVLVLIFQAIRNGAARWGAEAAFLAGFRGALTCAALIAAALFLVGLFRFPGRARST